MFKIFVTHLSTLGIFALSSATQQEILGGNGNGNSPLNAEFSKLVNETLEMLHVPGVSIAVVDGNEMWAEVSGILYDQSLHCT